MLCPWTGKQGHWTEQEAPEAVKVQASLYVPGLRVYVCGACRRWHLSKKSRRFAGPTHRAWSPAALVLSMWRVE